LTQPHRAYFGQKDAQQVVVIQHMVHDLNFPIELVICPTVRETDGLAMSSRNRYLTPDQRQAAIVVVKSLQAASNAYAQGERAAERLRSIVRAEVEREPLAALDYISIADTWKLCEIEETLEGPALLSLAVAIGDIHLIDNVVLAENANSLIGLTRFSRER
jgi:pantoate--beta-alanine ligase